MRLSVPGSRVLLLLLVGACANDPASTKADEAPPAPEDSGEPPAPEDSGEPPGTRLRERHAERRADGGGRPRR